MPHLLPEKDKVRFRLLLQYLSPNEREIIKYSPPPSTLLLVAISEMANAVGIVTMMPKKNN